MDKLGLIPLCFLSSANATGSIQVFGTIAFENATNFRAMGGLGDDGSDTLHLSPLQNNILVALAMIFYFKCAVEFATWMRSRLGMKDSKELLQMSLSTLVIFWPMFDTNNWSWKLNTVVPAVMAGRMIYKGALDRDHLDLDVQNLSHSSSPTDLLLGPMWTSCVMIWLGLRKFGTLDAALLAAVGFGDALAPIIGRRYGRHLFHVPLGSVKTIEGSVVGVFLGTILSAYSFLYTMGLDPLPLRMVLAYAGFAAVVEGTSPAKLDNLLAPIALHLSMSRISDLVERI